jgi:glycosyltransferase involved in cell wall biosynthesis
VVTLRILHVLEAVEGGTATLLRALVAEQLRCGHFVGAVVADRGPLADDLRALGASVTAIELRRELWAPVADAGALRRLVATVRSDRWDIVHTHDSRAGVLGRPVARALGVPNVHSAHSFAHLTQGVRGRGRSRYALTWAIEWALAPLSAAITVPSVGFAEQAIASRVVSRRRVEVVHNGYDPAPAVAPDRELAALAAQAPLIGFLSRMTGVKDPLGLLEALALLRDRGIDFRAAFVGDGPLESEVAERATAHGLADHVLVRPFTGLGAGPALAAFDIYVLPSTFEPFGIGLLEGMAAGLPTVATRVGGMPEIVRDGETGYLVEPADPTALADALQPLVTDPDLRQRMGSAGRARARMFSVSAMAERMDAVYERATHRDR